MTNIKVFEESNKQYFENFVNKWFEKYENDIKVVSKDFRRTDDGLYVGIVVYEGYVEDDDV